MRPGVASIVIRPAVEADLPKLEWEGRYLHFRNLFRRAFAEQGTGRRLLLVAAAPDGRLVGQVFIQLYSSDAQFADGHSRAYLYSLRVREELRGQGLGTRLLRAAEAELTRRGFHVAVIAASRSNPRARRLYERLGYRVFAEDPGEWDLIDPQGESRQYHDPSWLLEKTLEAGRDKGHTLV